MDRVLVLGDLYAVVARRDELRELLANTQARAREEPGCLAYVFAEHVGDPGHYVIAQEWRDPAALETHYRSKPFADYQARVGEFLARPSDVRIHHVRDSVRPEDSTAMDPRRAD